MTRILTMMTRILAPGAAVVFLAVPLLALSLVHSPALRHLRLGLSCSTERGNRGFARKGRGSRLATSRLTEKTMSARIRNPVCECRTCLDQG